MMSAAARSLELHPFTGPAAITSRPYEGRPACVYHGYLHRRRLPRQREELDRRSARFQRRRRPAGSRWSPKPTSHELKWTATAAPAASRTSRATPSSSSPPTWCFIASQTYENVRLLLLSKSAAFPNGLSNNHAQVGQHYFSHAQFGGVTALFPFDLRNWYGTPGQGICVDNWADDNFDHSGLDFIGGGTMYVYTERRPMAAVNGLGAWGRQGPNWGSEWKAHVIENVDRTNGAYMQRTTLPYEGNYLDLDPVGERPARQSGNPNHGVVPRERAEDQRVRRREDAAVVSRGGRRPGAGNRHDQRRQRDGRHPRTRTAARAWATTRTPTS